VSEKKLSTFSPLEKFEKPPSGLPTPMDATICAKYLNVLTNRWLDWSSHVQWLKRKFL